MRLKRNERNKVVIYDTVEKRYIEMNACSAREALSHPKNEGRFVDQDAIDGAKLQNAIDAGVEKALEGQKITFDQVMPDIKAAHDTIMDSLVDGDPRLTPTGLIKKAVLSEKLGRTLSATEWSTYMSAVKNASAPE